MHIQWFPGHMAKTRRLILEHVKLVDLVVELVDARLPQSSRNPEIDQLIKDKPRLLVLNKADIADRAVTDAWIAHLKAAGIPAIAVSSTSGKPLAPVLDMCKAILAPQISAWQEKGMVGKPIKLMVVGVPNVGKSSFINKLTGKKSAITGDRPGVTRGKQWIRLANGFELLDTPGILWPKFEDEQIGLKLAFTGAVKDDILDVELLACKLLEFLRDTYPEALAARYHMEVQPEMEGYQLLEQLGKKRGFVISGGEIDSLRAANILLDEFRAAKLGFISLESPKNV